MAESKAREEREERLIKQSLEKAEKGQQVGLGAKRMCDCCLCCFCWWVIRQLGQVQLNPFGRW